MFKKVCRKVSCCLRAHVLTATNAGAFEFGFFSKSKEQILEEAGVEYYT